MKHTVIAALLLSGLSPAWGRGPAIDVPSLPDMAEQSPAADHLTIRTVASHTQVTPGTAFHVALDVGIEKGWVLYSSDGGPDVIIASLSVDAGKLVAGEPLWPRSKSKTTDLGDGRVTNNVYEGRALIYVPITVPRDARHGESRILLDLDGQICSQEGQCVPLGGFTPGQGISTVAVVEVADRTAANPAWIDDLAEGLSEAASASRPAGPADVGDTSASTTAGMAEAIAATASYTLWGGLGLALLAGLTLNIMPCVLPIIPLRILSLVQMAGESRRRFVTLGLAFAGGIVLFFLGLGAVNVVIKQLGGATLDINEHFKYPAVRIGIAMLLLALAANLFGLFNVTVPTKLAGMGQDRKGRGHLSAAGMGLMMAVLATPCSFWLMALSLAWAQLQPMWLGTLAIVLIGVGMAAPHAVLASFPDLLRRLPAPGAWMELFKQTMGFLLLPAVLFLLGTLTEESSWPIRVAGFGVVLTFSLWVWGKWVRYDATLKKKLIVRGLAVAVATTAGLWLLPKPAPPMVKFEAFGQARIAQARAEGKIVVVKVTASWCTSCKLLDYWVFNTPQVAKEFADRGVVAIKADVSNPATPASRWVRENFRTSPPLTIIYPADGGEPFTKVGGFDSSDLIRWLDEAAGKK